MVEHFPWDSPGDNSVPVELRASDDPVVPYIKERFRADATFLYKALEREKHYSKDPLTGVGSIHAFYDEVVPLVETETTNRYLYGDQTERLALAHVDIDRLKDTNDRFGHTKGDELLQVVAKSLQRLSRPFDRVYRTGGDEFTVIMPGFMVPVPEREEKMLLAKVDHFQNGIAVDIALHDFAPELSIGASVGIALLTAQDDITTWRHRADQMMYLQKSLHRLE